MFDIQGILHHYRLDGTMLSQNVTPLLCNWDREDKRSFRNPDRMTAVSIDFIDLAPRKASSLEHACTVCGAGGDGYVDCRCHWNLPGRDDASMPLMPGGNAPKSNLMPSQCSPVRLTGSRQYHAPEPSLAVPGRCGREQERREEGESKKELISKLTISLVLDGSQCGRPADMQSLSRATTSPCCYFSPEDHGYTHPGQKLLAPTNMVSERARDSGH